MPTLVLKRVIPLEIDIRINNDEKENLDIAE